MTVQNQKLMVDCQWNFAPLKPNSMIQVLR
uniref:Uncharacterized protein n=1 Tax=Arundo donax TaxID=35708 RepID=A0A0A8ZZ40_ARUDO